MHEERKACIDAIEKMYGPVRFMDVPNIKTDLEEIREEFKLTKEQFNRFDFLWLKGKVIISDWVRFWECYKNPTFWWMDTDIMPVHKWKYEWFNNDGAKPYVWNWQDDKEDYCILYSNGAGQWCYDKMKESVDENYVTVMIRYMNMDNLNHIPDKYFRHLSYSLHKEEHWQIKHFYR
jgi:hypothetical protein